MSLTRRTVMLFRGSIGTIAVAALVTSIATAQAFDDAKYPDLSGLWRAVNLGVGGQAAFDPTKPWGRGQQAPLTPEYQAIHEASLADQANGGQGNWQSGARCMPPGMPASMNVDRQLDRCRRQRPFQPAGSRDSLLQGPTGSGPNWPAGPC